MAITEGKVDKSSIDFLMLSACVKCSELGDFNQLSQSGWGGIFLPE